MVRVLVVSSKFPPEYSGSGLRAHTTYQRLSQKFKVQYSVLCSSIEYNGVSHYKWEGVPVTRIAVKPFRFLFPDYRIQKETLGLGRRILQRMTLVLNYWCEAVPTFWFLFKRRRSFDVVHIFGNVAVTSVAMLFARLSGKRVLVEICNPSTEPFSYRPFPLSLIDEKPFYGRIPVICISEQLRQMCERNGLVSNVWTRPNPVDPNRFQVAWGKKDILRSQYTPFLKSDIVISQIALFNALKNQSFMLDVMQRLPNEFKLVLAGPATQEGPQQEANKKYFQELQRRVRDEGLGDRVLIRVGFVNNVDEYMKMSDIYVMPSQNEGLGTPMLESIACGVPVVAARLPGVTDVWIRNGENGYVCDLNPVAFAQAIRQAAAIPQDRLKHASEEMLRVAGIETIDSHYYTLLQQPLTP